jgi:Zn-dependent protease
MNGSLRIARVAGININLHATFLLVVLLGAWQWGGLGVQGMAFGALLTLLVFVSVTLHELGHSLVAKAFGIPVRDITLTPLGGIAQLGARPKTPGQELLIAVAGPAVNVALALMLGALAVWQFGADQLFEALRLARQEQPTVTTLWAMVVMSNVGLAVFNMVPALPMDGGRVLRAVLAWVVGLEVATKWSARVGRVLATLFVAAGFFTGNLTLGMVGIFVFIAAGLEEKSVRQDRIFEGVRAGDVVNAYSPRFMADTTLGDAIGVLVASPDTAFAVEHFGRLVGVVTRAELIRAANEEGPWGWVTGAMQRDVPTVSANDSLDAARLKMNESLSPFVAVVADGLFLGLITEAELARQAALADVLAARPRVVPGVRAEVVRRVPR